MDFSFFSNSRRRTVLRSGLAARVIFYYPGEDGTYLDGARVTVYDSGIVDVEHVQEQVTTHIQNVEIIWKNSRTLPGERTFVLHSFDRKMRGAPEERPKD